MKHLFVTQDYAPDLGGMARRHVELCRRFAPEPVTVSTVAAPGGVAFDAGEPYEIRRQSFPFARAKTFLSQTRWARSLVDACDAGTELLHCGNIRPCGYAVWWAHRRRDVPYLVYVYGGDLLRERRKAGASAFKREAAARILGEAAGIVAISAWTAGRARALLEAVGVRRPPPIATIDLGTDPVQFNPTNDHGRLRERFGLGDAHVVLTVARLVPHKGQDVAIRAIARLANEDPLLRYVMIGEGNDEPRLRALARECGVEDRVIFAGALSDEDVADAYATSAVYLGLSRLDDEVNVEGFGLAFIEAGASGVPCVAGDSGGVSAAVRDGETGVLVPPCDVDCVCAALRGMLDDPTRRARMGSAARRAVEEYYNWDRVAADTLAFAHEVTGVSRVERLERVP